MTSLQALAVNTAAAVRLSIADRHQHREECAMCRPDQECPRAMAMFADHQARVQRARSNLLTYLPHGSVITYAGALTRMHGEWWINDTCADCDHTALRLVRGRGMTLSHVLLSEITSTPILQPRAGETLPAAREAARELAVILTMGNVTLPMIVDINGLGVCTLAYPRGTYDHEISVAESTRTAEASYTLAALRAVPVLASAMANGNAAGVSGITERLLKLREAAADVRRKSR
ncbi:hypothetical protein FAF44_02895 [Nonomuraea sp. MG754425]|uniref:hypothetical protein n=1 Tax=Nonomuraea sp. MG754425 TaxID=2570319 RepID=UPI001F4818B9|nr:hypothetical protein [Nonomuraea sp. MG754425]MCF6467362.1 hypothetical protein [Nonomuraea sp. MG754425]